MAHDVKVGAILVGDGQERDAIHLAVAPVIAGKHVRPGESIGFIRGDHETVGGGAETLIGIVDPFLEQQVVLPGQRFWMFLYPNTTRALRHDWTHPAFQEIGRDDDVYAPSRDDDSEYLFCCPEDDH